MFPKTMCVIENAVNRDKKIESIEIKTGLKLLNVIIRIIKTRINDTVEIIEISSEALEEL